MFITNIAVAGDAVIVNSINKENLIYINSIGLAIKIIIIVIMLFTFLPSRPYYCHYHIFTRFLFSVTTSLTSKIVSLITIMCQGHY